MKKSILLLLLIPIFSCKSHQIRVENSSLKMEAFPLPVPEQNSLMFRWEKKPVQKTSMIDDMESGTGWQVTGIGEMSYTKERARDGIQSLRFRTSLRDEEHYRTNRSAWNSFNGSQGGVSSVWLQFDTPRDWSAFNRLSFWVYVHPTTLPAYCLHLTIENEGTIYNATCPGKEHFIQDLKPGIWNHVLFEIPHLKRDRVTSIAINQMLTGHTPEEDGIVTYDIDRLELQLVEADQYHGWNVSPGKFAFSHIGYRPGDPKIALVGEGGGDNFQLIDQEGRVVFMHDVKDIESRNGKFRQLDFSGFSKEGIYRLLCGPLESDPFPVSENIWLQPVFKAINFYFCERCGFSVPGIHTECHRDWQGFRGDVKKIINGGWHDAGDLSQGSWRTAMTVFAMMRNMEALEERKDATGLADLIRTEMKWGLAWLLKTRFGDGFHMSFSVMRIYTDNQVGTIDDVVSPADNVPWENFLAAAVECKAAMMLQKSDPDMAGQAGIAATEDWQAAVDSRPKWDQADYREAAWGATSSILLGQMTGDKKYKERAVQFGGLLMHCQQQSFVNGMPLAGYFYENTSRSKVIHNYHASFEEAPLIALAMLCREYPDDVNWMKWYSAAVLHSEFFLKRGSQIASPYDLLPNSVWKKEEITAIKEKQVREDMLRQFNDGTPLCGDYVLRTFPIYHDGLFHGNTNISMSETWALAEAARLRKDTAGMLLVGKQLQWVLGANPFGQSLMYGVGYNFAPHFAYCLRDVVGSLPVGMDCMSGDMPWWPATNTATTKEIWVEPVNRFLGAVAIYDGRDLLHRNNGSRTISLRTSEVKCENGIISSDLTFTGTGRHQIEIKTFNAKPGFDKKEINLPANGTENIPLSLEVSDHMKPCIAVIWIDHDPELRKEIVGALVGPSIPAKEVHP
jgi:hypothetical protein